MEISSDKVKQLRDATAAGIMDCKKALLETAGNVEKAIAFLRQQGLNLASKKRSRQVKAGIIEAYIHFGGNIGVLLEVDCETDFVARNEVFREFARNVAMQIAANSPICISDDDLKEFADQGYSKENCLLEQPFIKDTSMSIQGYMDSVIAKLGENVLIRRFVRFEVGA